ncbi:hypothetical protein LUPAC06_06219 [Micromonospora saelicesensis]|nr:hypothetical protein LUPAC06_06219 [Micromonospora saelicesensis]
MTDLTSAVWRKSTRSGDNGGNCVEVADNLPGFVAVRDSKDPTGPALVVAPQEWRDFLIAIKRQFRRELSSPRSATPLTMRIAGTASGHITETEQRGASDRRLGQ